jgi:drug/metabolite transporter (DMT)-like permease
VTFQLGAILCVVGVLLFAATTFYDERLARVHGDDMAAMLFSMAAVTEMAGVFVLIGTWVGTR